MVHPLPRHLFPNVNPDDSMTPDIDEGGLVHLLVRHPDVMFPFRPPKDDSLLQRGTPVWLEENGSTRLQDWSMATLRGLQATVSRHRRSNRRWTIPQAAHLHTNFVRGPVRRCLR